MPPFGFGILALLVSTAIPVVGDSCQFFFSNFLVGVAEFCLKEPLGAADESLIAGNFFALTVFLFLGGRVITLAGCCCAFELTF